MIFPHVSSQVSAYLTEVTEFTYLAFDVERNKKEKLGRKGPLSITMSEQGTIIWVTESKESPGF